MDRRSAREYRFRGRRRRPGNSGRVYGGQSSTAFQRNSGPGRRRGKYRLVSAGGLRIWFGLDLHALRISNDSDHHVLLPEPPIGGAARFGGAGGGLLFGNYRVVQRVGPGADRRPGTDRKSVV